MKALINRFSWRGVEKSRELFEKFDSDRDGALSFSEFRGEWTLHLVAGSRPNGCLAI